MVLDTSKDAWWYFREFTATILEFKSLDETTVPQQDQAQSEGECVPQKKNKSVEISQQGYQLRNIYNQMTSPFPDWQIISQIIKTL